MVKQKEALTERNEPAIEQAQPDDLMARLFALEERVAQLEKHAHSDHQLDKSVVDQIAMHATQHAVGQMSEHLRRMIGHSGMPARGDQG